MKNCLDVEKIISKLKKRQYLFLSQKLTLFENNLFSRILLTHFSNLTFMIYNSTLFK